VQIQEAKVLRLLGSGNWDQVIGIATY